jgi:hypothetical protein
MTGYDVLRRVIEALDLAGIPHMLTGSFASSYHGAPRATQDIDIVISPTTDQLRSFVSRLPVSEYYVDEEAALEAQLRETQFNVIDFVTGWKIDLIIRKSRAFSRTEFGRRVSVDFQGIRLFVATAEDVLLAKLEWAKQDQSQRQIDDAAGILRIRATDLDRGYIEKWVGQLRLEEPWGAACRAAGITL